MTMNEIKQLKKGDKFWISRYSGFSGDFQRNILGLEVTPFNLIQATFEEFPENCWYIPNVPQYNGEKIAWVKCRVQGLIVDIHTSSLINSASKMKSKCQAMLLKSRPWEIKTNHEKKLFDAAVEEFPEMFL
jgi:hypothetical protein